MKIVHKNRELKLEDELLDVGYSAEKVELTAKGDTKVTVGGHRGKTQLLISLPFIDEAVEAELAAMESLLNETAQAKIDAWIVVANAAHTLKKEGFFKLGIDADEGFGDYYGVRLEGEGLSGELTKALTIVAEDGTLFYIDAPADLSEPFNTERFARMIVTALSCCDKKGCH